MRDGLNGFSVIFSEILDDGHNSGGVTVDDQVAAGDFLNGFHLSTRAVLAEKGRESQMITVGDVYPQTVGMLIALFERAAGFYASIANINDSHQLGVEGRKKAVGKVIEIQKKILHRLSNNSNKLFTPIKL